MLRAAAVRADPRLGGRGRRGRRDSAAEPGRGGRVDERPGAVAGGRIGRVVWPPHRVSAAAQPDAGLSGRRRGPRARSAGFGGREPVDAVGDAVTEQLRRRGDRDEHGDQADEEARWRLRSGFELNGCQRSGRTKVRVLSASSRIFTRFMQEPSPLDRVTAEASAACSGRRQRSRRLHRNRLFRRRHEGPLTSPHGRRLPARLGRRR